jgi:hypothetical protein
VASSSHTNTEIESEKTMNENQKRILKKIGVRLSMAALAPPARHCGRMSAMAHTAETSSHV